MRKYEITNETQIVNPGYGEVTLHRIRATRDFGSVKAGDLGGWIESETNLSHEGNAWVYDEAKIYGNAAIFGHAKVCENAEVWGNAKIYGKTLVGENAKVCDYTEVFDYTAVWGNAKVYGNAKIYGTALVWGNARILDYARVYGNAKVGDYASIESNAQVYGSADVKGRVIIAENAKVFDTSHVLAVGPMGKRQAFTTFYRDTDNEITVQCGGWFTGKVDEFLQKVTEIHDNSKHASVYRAAAEIARLQINLEN